MSDKWKEKYRIDTARKPGWDYSSPGDYLITVCTKHRKHFFGECTDGKMKLNLAGAAVQGFWYEIPKHFSHIELGKFVVMPNHIHGILTIKLSDTPEEEKQVASLPDINRAFDGDLRKQPDFYKKIHAKKGSISVVVGSFKGACRRAINRYLPAIDFEWQSRFHDRVLRDESELRNANHYIVFNPEMWEEDKLKDPLNDEDLQA